MLPALGANDTEVRLAIVYALGGKGNLVCVNAADGKVMSTFEPAPVDGKATSIAQRGKIIHVDVDASEIHKNKEAHIPIVADLKKTLQALNAMVEDEDLPDVSDWQEQIDEWKQQHPLRFRDSSDEILHQYAIERMWQLVGERDPYVAVGVGQHQMWSAQFFRFNRPRHWLSSSGLGTMGFGLPAAMGVAAQFPNELVIDIDGDGSFQMNIQELATLRCENLPVKILLLNNQHLGMVTQWEDRFMDGRRAHTYLGPIDKPEALGLGDGTHGADTYPDFVAIAKGYGIPAEQVRDKSQYDAAVQRMVETDGPYLLEVICPYQEHVLPMIPSGKTVRDIITE